MALAILFLCSILMVIYFSVDFYSISILKTNALFSQWKEGKEVPKETPYSQNDG
jgi:hypothetical protein